jgi:DNA-binding GntR family transcriptional regulator
LPKTGASGTRKANAAERVTASLRKAILQGELLPGDYIRQEKWAARLKMSRLPVREALKILASEGLVVHDPNKGYSVARLDVAEMSQIYLMRRLLEPELIKTLRWPDARETAHLRELGASSEAALNNRDPVRCMELERRIDYLIYDLSRLKVVVREVKRLWELIDPYRFLVFAEPEWFYGQDTNGLVLRHRLIFGALEARDLDALQEAFSRNYENMMEYFHHPPFVQP